MVESARLVANSHFFFPHFVLPQRHPAIDQPSPSVCVCLSVCLSHCSTLDLLCSALLCARDIQPPPRAGLGWAAAALSVCLGVLRSAGSISQPAAACTTRGQQQRCCHWCHPAHVDRSITTLISLCVTCRSAPRASQPRPQPPTATDPPPVSFAACRSAADRSLDSSRCASRSLDTELPAIANRHTPPHRAIDPQRRRHGRPLSDQQQRRRRWTVCVTSAVPGADPVPGAVAQQ